MPLALMHLPLLCCRSHSPKRSQEQQLPQPLRPACFQLSRRTHRGAEAGRRHEKGLIHSAKKAEGQTLRWREKAGDEHVPPQSQYFLQMLTRTLKISIDGRTWCSFSRRVLGVGGSVLGSVRAGGVLEPRTPEFWCSVSNQEDGSD